MKLNRMGVVVALLASSFVHGQDGMMMGVPAEMKQLDFMEGTWSGSMKMSMGEGEPQAATLDVVYEKTLGGMYVKGMHTFNLPNMPAMTGMLMMTYNPKSKAWMSWWFDSAAPEAMEMKGEMKGNAWVFLSKPTEMEGMGVMTTRATYTKVSDSHMKMKLEMKPEKGDWMTFIDADYTKK